MEKVKITGRISPVLLSESGEMSKDGVSSITSKYRWPLGMAFLGVDTVHPSYPGMLLTKCSWELMDNKIFNLVSYVYEGDVNDSDGSGSGFEPRRSTEVRVSVQEEPIACHPKFKDFATEDNAHFDENKIFVGFKKDSPYAGITSYFAPGAEFSETTTSRTGGISLSSVGKIDSPPGGAPGVPGGYNWLYMGATQTKHGTITTTTRVWKLSGRGGWNSTIYR